MVKSQNNIKRLYLTSFYTAFKDAMIINFLYVYLIRLNANDAFLAMFQILPAIAGILALAGIMRFLDNSKETFVKFVIIDRLAFIAFCITLFYIRNPLIIVMAYSLYSLPVTIGSTLFPNFLKECIPQKEWGSVFSNNKLIFIIIDVFTLLIIGTVLNYFNNSFPYNYILVFLISGISYLLSYFHLKHLDADIKINKIPKLEFNPFGKINKGIIILLVVQIPVSVIAALWSIYDVRELYLNDSQIAILLSAYCLGGFLSLPIWGKIIDKFSQSKLFIISTFLSLSISMLYVLHNNFYYLALVEFLIGVMWNGYEVICGNMLMDGAKHAQYDYIYISNYQIMSSVVKLVFPALGLYIYPFVGIKNMFIAIGMLGFAISLIIAFSILTRPQKNIYDSTFIKSEA